MLRCTGSFVCSFISNLTLGVSFPLSSQAVPPSVKLRKCDWIELSHFQFQPSLLWQENYEIPNFTKNPPKTHQAVIILWRYRERTRCGVYYKVGRVGRGRVPSLEFLLPRRDTKTMAILIKEACNCCWFIVSEV